MRVTFLRFCFEEMTAMNMSSFNVVLPRTSIATRGEAPFNAWKYFAICR